jgi:hypothetical protein
MDPFQLEQGANQALDPGETLVWCGAPDPVRIAVQALPMALFGGPFVGFAAFWIVTTSGLASSAPSLAGPVRLFPLFGLPCLLIGLAMLSAPLWTFLGARRTLYGITNRRVFIAGRGGKAVRSFARSDIGDLEHVERDDGTGDLYFAMRRPAPPRTHRRHFVPIRAELRTRIGFIGIRDVRHVEATLREQLEFDAAEAARPPAPMKAGRPGAKSRRARASTAR